MTAANNAIRGTIGPIIVCTEETLAALNHLVGGEAHFLVTGKDHRKLVVEFRNAVVAYLGVNT